MSIAFWICAAVTAVSAFVSLGFSIAALVVEEPARSVGLRYALARSIAVGVTVTIAFFVGSVGFLAAIAIVMIVVQAGDSLVGGTIRDRMKTAGPAVLAVLNIAALIWLLVS